MKNKKIIYTSFQEIIIEKDDSDMALFLDGELQFLQSENHLYDNAMVDIPISYFS